MVLDTWILIGLTALFSFSVSAGLDKGIKLLSDINVGLAFLLLSIVLLAGPTSFIVNQALDSLGVLFQNFISMSLTTDAGGTSTFAQDNTVFFWAWWMAWAPFMGLFIARISGGRTLRQVIVGVIGGGSLGCWVGFSILGHATMHLLSSGDPAMTALYESAQSGSGVDAPAVVIALLNAQPVAVVFKGLFFVLCFIFVATSLDSAAFTLASTATQDLHIEDQPARWHRLVWAFVLSATALSLMYVGGLQVLQAASVALGLPILVIMGMLVVVFMRRMNKKTD